MESECDVISGLAKCQYGLLSTPVAYQPRTPIARRTRPARRLRRRPCNDPHRSALLSLERGGGTLLPGDFT